MKSILDDLNSKGKFKQALVAADHAPEVRGCIEDVRDTIMDYQVRSHVIA